MIFWTLFYFCNWKEIKMYIVEMVKQQVSGRLVGSVTVSKCSVQLLLAESTSWPTLASRRELSIAGRAVVFGHTCLLSEVTYRSLWIQPSRRILSSWIPVTSDTFYSTFHRTMSECPSKKGQYHRREPESVVLCNSVLTHYCKGLFPGMTFCSLFFWIKMSKKKKKRH